MTYDTAKGAEEGRAPEIQPDPVHAFYASHPYPPPVANLDQARDGWKDEKRHRAEYHLFWPDRPYRAKLDILIAGCGTFQSAKHALCYPDARVVGIDVSATSINHTERLKKKYNLTNLETQQWEIEKVAALERDFDLIICTGVLHHLADPDAGLRALRSVLRPNGAMYLMVYAPYGRTGIYMLQEYCRKLGVGTSKQEIDELVPVLTALPHHHPLVGLLHTSRDAQSPDGLADALLNPRDRSYSVPQLFDWIERNGLSLGRWYRQAPYLPQCGAIASTPHANRLDTLSQREQFAAMELWRGTMTVHSLVVHRDDSDAGGVKVRFDDERWLNYVPIRLPSTLCIQERERLPAGAAAVLLNRSHQYPDLILPISALEKRLFDAIDGHRGVAEIIDYAHAGKEHHPARTFFEKLWQYDQVVYDVSKPG